MEKTKMKKMTLFIGFLASIAIVSSGIFMKASHSSPENNKEKIAKEELIEKLIKKGGYTRKELEDFDLETLKNLDLIGK